MNDIIDFSHKKRIKETEENGDNTKWTVIDMLKKCIKDYEKGEYKIEEHDKAIILLLDDKDKYDHTFYAANMKSSEMIALLEVTKQTIISNAMEIDTIEKIES